MNIINLYLQLVKCILAKSMACSFEKNSIYIKNYFDTLRLHFISGRTQQHVLPCSCSLVRYDNVSDPNFVCIGCTENHQT